MIRRGSVILSESGAERSAPHANTIGSRDTLPHLYGPALIAMLLPDWASPPRSSGERFLVVARHGVTVKRKKVKRMKEDTQRKKSLSALLRRKKASKLGKRAARVQKHVHRTRREARLTPRQARKFSLVTVGAVALIAGGTWAFMTLTPDLPPTETRGHTEDIPPGHVLPTRMSELVQRHMLEHADGKGPPGVIVQYNCEDYMCEAGLVERLENLIRRYTYVYLAPGDYDGKITLTKRGKMEILEAFDERRIENFIEG